MCKLYSFLAAGWNRRQQSAAAAFGCEPVVDLTAESDDEDHVSESSPAANLSFEPTSTRTFLVVFNMIVMNFESVRFMLHVLMHLFCR